MVIFYSYVKLPEGKRWDGKLTIKKGEVFVVPKISKNQRCDMMVIQPSKKLEVKQQEMWI